MSETNGHKPEVPTEELPNGGRPWINIIVNENGGLAVNGSINDKVLAYGLLESARDAIKAHHDRLSQASIVKPSRNIFRDGLRGMK